MMCCCGIVIDTLQKSLCSRRLGWPRVILVLLLFPLFFLSLSFYLLYAMPCLPVVKRPGGTAVGCVNVYVTLTRIASGLTHHERNAGSHWLAVVGSGNRRKSLQTTLYYAEPARVVFIRLLEPGAKGRNGDRLHGTRPNSVIPAFA